MNWPPPPSPEEFFWFVCSVVSVLITWAWWDQKINGDPEEGF